RTRSKLQKTADEINATKKIPMAEVFPADVTDTEDIQELADYVEQQFGDLHILVNNAGSSISSKILDTTEAEWDSIQNSNLKSVFLVSRILGKLMANSVKKEILHSHDRAIVNVASLSGHHAGAQIPLYSAAKAAVINFTQSLAIELAPYGIRVNSVSPGFIETPLTEKGMQNEDFAHAMDRNTALKRAGKAEEIASVIAFLASTEASYMTGSDVLVDGGWQLM
ncbi:MAG: SDR family oxidoreductase, partial [Bacillota bacterium]|nr:SDR family oxidoreductase [Bacillota bacterium]